MLTSPLERLNGSLCDAVTGYSGSQELLKQLERANIFLVPLDGVRYWYRYHALFADVLQSRLWQMHPELAPLLYRRAAEWYRDHGYTAEAINYRLRAEHNDPTIAPDNRLQIAAIEPALPGSGIENVSRSADYVIDGAQASGAPRLVDEQAALPPAVWIADDHLLGERRSQLALPAAQRLTSVQLVEQLTTRELEILHLMAEGLTYLQMSHRLVLGLNTVRFHVKNIYGKLNVHQRFQAIARARELHLLPEQGPHQGA
jgi:ATP/maltotriose-dependent transcriptional regulator MalT